MLLLAVMCVPAAIMVAVAVTTKAHELPLAHAYTRWAIVMQAVISLYVASQAPQSVSRDLRFKTVPLYFSRPIETADYVLAKFAALASALFVLTGAPLIVMYLGSLLAKMGFAHQTGQFARDWSPWPCSRCCSPVSASSSPRSPRAGASASPP